MCAYEIIFLLNIRMNMNNENYHQIVKKPSICWKKSENHYFSATFN